MLRQIALLVSSVAAVGLLALPADAKTFGLEQVSITGPGLEEPLILTNKQFGIPDNENHPSAVALEGMLGRIEKRKEPPPGELGPRYRLAYRLGLTSYPNRPAIVVQHLYPYADRGAVTFTPAGQTVRLSRRGDNSQIRRGWQRFPKELVDTLEAHGLPRGFRANLGAAQEGALELLGLATGAGIVGAVLVALISISRRQRVQR